MFIWDFCSCPCISHSHLTCPASGGHVTVHCCTSAVHRIRLGQPPVGRRHRRSGAGHPLGPGEINPKPQPGPGHPLGPCTCVSPKPLYGLRARGCRKPLCLHNLQPPPHSLPLLVNLLSAPYAHLLLGAALPRRLGRRRRRLRQRRPRCRGMRRADTRCHSFQRPRGSASARGLVDSRHRRYVRVHVQLVPHAAARCVTGAGALTERSRQFDTHWHASWRLGLLLRLVLGHRRWCYRPRTACQRDLGSTERDTGPSCSPGGNVAGFAPGRRIRSCTWAARSALPCNHRHVSADLERECNVGMFHLCTQRWHVMMMCLDGHSQLHSACCRPFDSPYRSLVI